MVKSHNQPNTIRRVEEKQALRDFAILYQYASALLYFYGEEMKRFTETSKWNDPWYRKLSCKHKAFWQFICDGCDNAGVWKIDYELASFQIGEVINEADIKILNDGKERLVIKGELLIIRDFIPFQVGNLKGDNLTNLQKNCLRLIDEYKKKGLSLTGKVGVVNPKRSSIGIGKGIDIKIIIEYFIELKHKDQAEPFYDFYQSKGWKVGKAPMKDWKAAARNWCRRISGDKSGDTPPPVFKEESKGPKPEYNLGQRLEVKKLIAGIFKKGDKHKV